MSSCSVFAIYMFAFVTGFLLRCLLIAESKSEIKDQRKIKDPEQLKSSSVGNVLSVTSAIRLVAVLTYFGNFF